MSGIRQTAIRNIIKPGIIFFADKNGQRDADRGEKPLIKLTKRIYYRIFIYNSPLILKPFLNL